MYTVLIPYKLIPVIETDLQVRLLGLIHEGNIMGDEWYKFKTYSKVLYDYINMRLNQWHEKTKIDKQMANTFQDAEKVTKIPVTYEDS